MVMVWEACEPPSAKSTRREWHEARLGAWEGNSHTYTRSIHKKTENKSGWGGHHFVERIAKSGFFLNDTHTFVCMTFSLSFFACFWRGEEGIFGGHHAGHDGPQRTLVAFFEECRSDMPSRQRRCERASERQHGGVLNNGCFAVAQQGLFCPLPTVGTKGEGLKSPRLVLEEGGLVDTYKHTTGRYST